MKKEIKIIEVSADRNGNKVLKIKIDGKGKSIQTLANLPNTHRNFTKRTKGFTALETLQITKEIEKYLKTTGLKAPATRGLRTLCAKAFSVNGLRKKDGTQKKGYVAKKGGKLVKKTTQKTRKVNL